jgi:hypothetical protein
LRSALRSAERSCGAAPIASVSSGSINACSTASAAWRARSPTSATFHASRT